MVLVAAVFAMRAALALADEAVPPARNPWPRTTAGKTDRESEYLLEGVHWEDRLSAGQNAHHLSADLFGLNIHSRVAWRRIGLESSGWLATGHGHAAAEACGGVCSGDLWAGGAKVGAFAVLSSRLDRFLGAGFDFGLDFARFYSAALDYSRLLSFNDFNVVFEAQALGIFRIRDGWEPQFRIGIPLAFGSTVAGGAVSRTSGGGGIAGWPRKAFAADVEWAMVRRQIPWAGLSFHLGFEYRRYPARAWISQPLPGGLTTGYWNDGLETLAVVRLGLGYEVLFSSIPIRPVFSFEPADPFLARKRFTFLAGYRIERADIPHDYGVASIDATGTDFTYLFSADQEWTMARFGFEISGRQTSWNDTLTDVQGRQSQSVYIHYEWMGIARNYRPWFVAAGLSLGIRNQNWRGELPAGTPIVVNDGWFEAGGAWEIRYTGDAPWEAGILGQIYPLGWGGRSGWQGQRQNDLGSPHRFFSGSAVLELAYRINRRVALGFAMKGFYDSYGADNYPGDTSVSGVVPSLFLRYTWAFVRPLFSDVIDQRTGSE